MALYTQEQIDKANQTNLEEFLQQKGERLKKTGSESVLIYKDSTGEHDSISIRRNRWYDHKNMRGGYPLKFMQEFYGMTGSISQGRDKSKSLQMTGRPLMTPDELKIMPKDTFIVTRTGVKPMKTKLKLFFEWGIELNET